MTNGNENAFAAVGKNWIQEGLTKREYFAAMAMQGLITSGDAGAGDRLVDLPEYAVAIADALLDALNTEAE